MTKLSVVSDNPSPRKAPPAPASLGPIGRQEWRKVAPILTGNGMLTSENETLLVLYCQAIEGAQECGKILRKQGRVVMQKDGPPKAHPAVRQEAVYSQNALRYAEKIGLTGGKDRKPAPDGSAPSLVD